MELDKTVLLSPAKYWNHVGRKLYTTTPICHRFPTQTAEHFRISISWPRASAFFTDFPDECCAASVENK